MIELAAAGLLARLGDSTGAEQSEAIRDLTVKYRKVIDRVWGAV